MNFWQGVCSICSTPTPTPRGLGTPPRAGGGGRKIKVKHNFYEVHYLCEKIDGE